VLPDVVPEGKRPPAKKDPDLCKVVHWKGPHEPELRIREYSWRKTPTCHWRIYWPRLDPVWACAHEKVCAGCGKVLTVFVPAEQCPDFHSITGAEELALEQEALRWAERLATRRRRPVINGPQGYRKPKEQQHDGDQ
jgi:hypothetical protein